RGPNRLRKEQVGGGHGTSVSGGSRRRPVPGRMNARVPAIVPRSPEVTMANQFVVQLKNDPGAMATLAEALAARGVDLRAIGGGGYVYVEGESFLAEVDDKTGGMARLSRALADAGVNIYGHLFLGRWGDRAMFAFVVDRPDIARPILERKA